MTNPDKTSSVSPCQSGFYWYHILWGIGIINLVADQRSKDPGVKIYYIQMLK
jgi:hypothetical protein